MHEKVLRFGERNLRYIFFFSREIAFINLAKNVYRNLSEMFDT